jgi:hypothetical protein
MSSEACFAGDGRLPGDAAALNWCDHELWQQAGSGMPSAAAMEKPRQAVLPAGRARRDLDTRLRCRREIGRSLFRTFDSARRRCNRGSRISLSGL